MIVKHAQSARHQIMLLGITSSDEEALTDGHTVKLEAELGGQVWTILISLEDSEIAVEEDLQRIIENIELRGEMP